MRWIADAVDAGPNDRDALLVNPTDDLPRRFGTSGGDTALSACVVAGRGRLLPVCL